MNLKGIENYFLNIINLDLQYEQINFVPTYFVTTFARIKYNFNKLNYLKRKNEINKRIQICTIIYIEILDIR